ncbi:acetyltransferase [Blastocystis sp. subtype 4]|uniref:acetyltransferase n=1 Tax=Blastocystis sp. subtype 4 TaxID=944170 RepID=UPI000711991C|nr:acetyltransferase [Blastocystis sp. subtype 4]KNB45676.1 acetyltransferase [Blastocystis sp. subtype 4]|eukprot:XP_014529118.1 acetyltransferase [Blastocystis sp. subtype 4]
MQKASNDNNMAIAKEILTDAFREDPVQCALVRKDEHKEHGLQRLYDNILPPCVQGGSVYINEEKTGAMIWWIRDNCPMGNSYAISSVLTPWNWYDIAGSLRGIARMFYFSTVTNGDHPPFNHIYVFQIGVKSAEKQRGYGSKMMKELTSYADEHNYPIYLESSKEVNLPFYQKHGFFVLERKEIMSNFPPYWRMLRPASDPRLPFGINK